MSDYRVPHLSTLNRLIRVFSLGSGTSVSANNGRMRIGVTGGAITVTVGGAYPATLIGKKIEVWGAGGAGTLIDASGGGASGYSFNSTTGVITNIDDGTYLILIYAT